VLSEQFIVLRATEERLRAELDRRAQLVLPNDLKKVDGREHLQSVWAGQVRQFESRLAVLQGQRGVIREKIAQLEHQIVGGEAQAKAFRVQLVSVQNEMEAIRPLLEKGLVTRPRYLQLERTAAALEGQLADASANTAKARQAIAEQEQQIAQLDHDRLADVTKDLRDIQARLLEVIPKLTNAQTVLDRTEIRAPYTGQVVGLSVFSVGGVIQRGEKILDVVPERDSLVIEAQLGVEDISEVRPDMRADIHLTAYKARITPVVHGTVLQVSADRMTDGRTGAPYFVSTIRLDENELAATPHIQLYPGMPATVMITTTQRTALDYLIGPLAMSFNHAFRQR
jgi:HlyD family type I secretion membrane fusion protein